MNNIYEIDLKIDVEEQFIYSKVNFKYNCNLEKTKKLSFYIHKNMEIEAIVSDENITYEVGNEICTDCSFILESKLIEIIFDDFIYENEIVNLFFKYKGYLDIITESRVNRLTKEWIEIGLYTPWFPLDKEFRPVIFKTIIDIDNKYKIINSKKIGDKQVINQNIPSVDCTIIGSSYFKEVNSKIDDINLTVYYTEEQHKDLAEKISGFSKLIFKSYKPFGKIESEEFSVVIAPREDGGGYCRPGLIVVTPEDDLNELAYFKFLSHELAHLWWNKGDATSWEDWLNESFAEFSALIALRDNFGETEFNNKIKEFEESIKGLPPIRFLNRSDEKAFLVLYRKGPFILYKLEKEIGREKFLELLKLIHIKNINNTEELLEGIVNISSLETKDKINRLLGEELKEVKSNIDNINKKGKG